jgi:copper homeostasis protein
VIAVEACVETLAEALDAQAGGADRIELCADLASDGTTPPDDLIRACVRQLALPVFVMIRPRPGAFVFEDDEIERMLRQARHARKLGARGLVTGALDARGRVDVAALAALVREAHGLPVTFHRAFDRIDDKEAALEELAALGVSRVLTSGGAPTALEGAAVLARLVRQAGSWIGIVAGGGVRAHNVSDVIARTGAREVHGHFGTAAAVRDIVAAAVKVRTKKSE